MIYYRQIIFNASRLVGKYIKINNHLRINIPVIYYSLSVNNYKYLYKSNNRSYNNDNNKKYGNTNHNYFFLSGLFYGLFNFNNDIEEEEIPELIMTIKRSILAMQRKEFKKAERMLHVALREAQSLQNHNAITYIYDLMANVAFETEQFKKAESLFILVLGRLFAKGISQQDLKVMHISLKLANIYEHTGEIEKAETGYKFCLENIQIHADNDPENENTLILLAMACDWYAQMLLSLGKYADAHHYFERSYNLCVKVNGRVHEQTVNLLNYLGTVSCKMQEYDKAIEYLTTAIEIGRALPDLVHLGSVHVNLGDVYLRKGLYSEAKKACTNGRIIATKREDDESLVEANKCLADIEKLM
ncbi:hypothetical protein M0802_011242 [Mischocyttarus mexicanus]|nr:hypothetical protein M0802_011242 [Mischocyttarus mexicanus]